MTEPSSVNPATERGGDVDRVALFAHLRGVWCERKRASLGQLCERLGIQKQSLSSYATGNDSRRAPWWVILALLSDLGMEMRVSEDGVWVGKRAKPRQRDTFIPHLGGAE